MRGSSFVEINLRNKQKKRENSNGRNMRHLFRRRLEKGLLLFRCLKRIQQYDLAEMGKAVIPSNLDDFVNVVCHFYHDAFRRKWIGKYISLHNVCHPVIGSEELF